MTLSNTEKCRRLYWPKLNRKLEQCPSTAIILILKVLSLKQEQYEFRSCLPENVVVHILKECCVPQPTGKHSYIPAFLLTNNKI